MRRFTIAVVLLFMIFTPHISEGEIAIDRRPSRFQYYPGELDCKKICILIEFLDARETVTLRDLSLISTLNKLKKDLCYDV